MSRFLRALSKMGLVEMDDVGRPAAPPESELDDDELLELLGRDGPDDEAEPFERAVPETAPIAEASAPVDDAPGGEGPSEVQEGRPFEAIYAEATIGESPFPAEKMLRVLDGLAAMDPATRKAAVLAMDSADDAWTIDDPLLDADRKTRALHGAQAALSRTLKDAEARAEVDIRAQDEEQAAAVEEIRRSIAELEETMARVVADATTRREEIKQQLASTRGAVARETARFAAEMERLALLRRTFGETGSN